MFAKNYWSSLNNPQREDFLVTMGMFNLPSNVAFEKIPKSIQGIIATRAKNTAKAPHLYKDVKLVSKKSLGMRCK